MTLDQVRQASKALGPLLRRRGTSPAVGVSVRRALQALDKAFSGLSAEAQEETIAAGIAHLRGSVELIRQSDRPADHDHLEGVEKALALLSPAEDPVLAAPLPDLVLSGDRGARRSRKGMRASSGPAIARRPAAPGLPRLDSGAAGTLLFSYQAKLHVLHLVASEPPFTAVDLDAAKAELDKQVRALQWLGTERIPEILRVADDAKNLALRLAAGAALVHLGDARGAEMVMSLLGRAASEKQALPEISPTLLRTLTDETVLQWLRKVFLAPAHPAVCALLLPVLFEHNLLSSEELWQLASHPKDEIAVEAARALAWVGADFDLPALLAQVPKARTRRRASALLLTATMLGSRAALAEVRARVKAGGQVDRCLTLALAVAGDASDAALLAGLAEQSGGDAEPLLLAAANLGSAGTLAALPAFEGRVSASALGEARRMIAGDSSEDSCDGSGLRLLYGRPWSVAGVWARLQAADQPLQTQRRMLVELRVRTGQAPSGVPPMLCSTSAREKWLAGWKAHYAKANDRLAPGQWYYHGKTVARSGKDTPA